MTPAQGSVNMGWTDASDDWAAVYLAIRIPPSVSLIKTVNGLAIASVKTVNGLAIASVKTLNGLANV